MCGVNLFGYLGFLAGVQSSMSCDGVGRRGVLGGGGGVLYSSAVLGCFGGGCILGWFTGV